MNSPTLTAAHGTQLGVILGTAAYMAPEQARGSAVDKRADIWAFGVVLYEMLSGRPLFAADTVSDTLAGVLKSEIDLAALPAGTPPALRRLLRRCLERNPKNRLHDIADARIVLDDLLAGRTDSGEAPADGGRAPLRERTAGRRALPWLGAGLALGALGAALLDRTVLAPAPAEPPTLVSAHLQREGLRPFGVPRRQDDRLHLDARRPLADLAEAARDRRGGGADRRAVRLGAPVLSRRQHAALPARVGGAVRALPRPDSSAASRAGSPTASRASRPGLPTAAASP